MGTQEYKGIKGQFNKLLFETNTPQNKQENIYFAFENYLRKEFFENNEEKNRRNFIKV